MATIRIYKRNSTFVDLAELVEELSRIGLTGTLILVDYDGTPVGIITERDILKKVTAANKHPKEEAAQDIMSHPVISIMAHDSVETAVAGNGKEKNQEVGHLGTRWVCGRYLVDY